MDEAKRKETIQTMGSIPEERENTNNIKYLIKKRTKRKYLNPEKIGEIVSDIDFKSKHLFSLLIPEHVVYSLYSIFFMKLHQSKSLHLLCWCHVIIQKL